MSVHFTLHHGREKLSNLPSDVTAHHLFEQLNQQFSQNFLGGSEGFAGVL